MSHHNNNYNGYDQYGHNPRKPKRRRSRIGRFFKSFILTVIVTLTILVGGYGLWRTQVRPPERPTVHAILPLHISSNFDDPTPNPVDEDTLDALPPVIESHWRRRDIFLHSWFLG